MSGLDYIKTASEAVPADVYKRIGQLTYPSKGEEDPVQKINEGIEKNLQDLEARFAQPNWFKIAAGFAKPQLGGFTASLGSAAEAMGENVEQQRALAIPLSKMRTEMAVNTAILGKNKEVSNEINAWLSNPANQGRLPSDTQLADWRARAPEAPAVKSMDAQIAVQQKAREQAQRNIEIDKSLNRPPNPEDLAVLGRGKTTAPTTPTTASETKPSTIPTPLNPKDVKEGENVNFGFAKIHPDAPSTPLGAEKIKKMEDEAEDKFKSIATFGEQTNNLQLRQNIDQVLNFASMGQKEQAALAKVANVMGSDSKLLSALMASGEAGLHGSLNSMSASIGLPIRKFIDNFRDPEERKAAQMLTLALDNANWVTSQMRGGLKGGLPVAEANLLTAGLFSRDLNYHSLMHGLLQIDNSLDMYKNLYEGYSHLKNKYADQLTPYAPDYQIYRSDWYNNLVRHHAEQARKISDKYNKTFNP